MMQSYDFVRKVYVDNPFQYTDQKNQIDGQELILQFCQLSAESNNKQINQNEVDLYFQC